MFITTLSVALKLILDALSIVGTPVLVDTISLTVIVPSTVKSLCIVTPCTIVIALESSVEIVLLLNVKLPTLSPPAWNVKFPFPSVVNTCPFVPSLIPRSVRSLGILGLLVRSAYTPVVATVARIGVPEISPYAPDVATFDSPDTWLEVIPVKLDPSP